MERMAAHTRQPDVLRELFAALRNDPLVISECLARPILAERLVRECTSGSTIARGAPKAFASRPADPPDAAYKLPEISAPLHCTGDDAWAATTTANAPDAR